MTLWTSCTDDWNEHYDQEASDLSAYPTLLARLKDTSDPDVQKGRFAQFVRVLEATGYDQRLATPALYTVFAPMDMTAKEADEWIARFNQEKSTRQDAYNTAVTQFVQNHISLFGHNFVRHATSETSDTVSMLNGKYMRVHNDAGSNEWTVSPSVVSVTDVAAHGVITEKLLCNNGYLYKITGGALPCYLNVKEAADTMSVISKYVAYKGKYDEYDLDEQKSVPGDIVDGNQEYIDSVVNYENKELATWYEAYFHREDSSYLFLVPSDELWGKLYTEYSKYFNYKPSSEDIDAQEAADALKDIWTSRAIMYGRVFNLNSADNATFSKVSPDSLCATNYSKYQTRPYGHYSARYNGQDIEVDVDYRTYVFRKPTEANGILSNLGKPYPCSNGFIYVDNRDEDYLVKNNVYKTWFTSSSYSVSSAGIAPKQIDDKNVDRFNSRYSSVKSAVPWIVCRKKTCGEGVGEGFRNDKIYNVRVSASGDSTVYYLDTIGTKIYHVDGNVYREVTEKQSMEKVMTAGEVTNKPTHVYFDYSLGSNIMSNVYYNAYVVTVPSDVEGGDESTRAQGLAFKVIENYDEDEVGENGKYVPYNSSAVDSYYALRSDFDPIYVGDGDETTALKYKLPIDGFVMTEDVRARYDDTPDGRVFKYYEAMPEGEFSNFFPYEDGKEEYGQASDDFYVSSSTLRRLDNKVYVPKIQDVDVIQVMRAKSTEYASVNQENAPRTWVLRIYNALIDSQSTFQDAMSTYDDEGIKKIGKDLFDPQKAQMRIARIIVKPFKTREEAERYSIANLMEEYHIATTFQRTE
jgi:hypothetical protein